MARLNEPSVAADGIELLRRRFIRQNREIARVNSNQSLKIRSLENECARLLSENLELRGQILRLEKEIEDNSAQRIADHALELKAKMEAQILEWGSLLAGLGGEPPRKRLVPEGRRISKPRSSRSPPMRRSRDVARDAEALAAQEGRLAPIYENKPYPRATMNSEEILALCSEAEDAESPDLGPPPVSRFVEEDPVKVDCLISDSPTKSTGEPEIPTEPEEIKQLEAEEQPTPDIALSAESSRQDEKPKREVDSRRKQSTGASGSVLPPKPVSRSDKVGAKRKYGDENDVPGVSSGTLGRDHTSKSIMSNAEPCQDSMKPRIIKDLPAARRNVKAKAVVTAGALSTRKPLSAKSTNEDISSPRKGSKKPILDDAKAEKATVSKNKPIPFIEIPRPPPVSARPVLVSSLPDPETPFLDTPLVAPDTPDHSAQREATRDTPPPADISLSGEMSRPGRRARAAVSYAEPNLRDKMRRPSKQLVDAVTGEGRYVHRPASQKGGDPVAPPTTAKSKTGMDSSDQFSSLPAAEAVAKEAARRQSVVSPLAKREPAAGITRALAATAGIDAEQSGDVQATDGKSTLGSTAAGDGSFGDIYDFSSTSPVPVPNSNNENAACKGEGKPETSRSSSRSSRRSGIVLQDRSTLRTVEGHDKGRSGGSRKRASMAAPRRGNVDVEDNSLDSSPHEQDKEPVAIKDRVSRRRSMML